MTTSTMPLPVPLSWLEILRTPDSGLRRLLAERYRAAALSLSAQPDKRQAQLAYEIARLELAAARAYERRLADYAVHVQDHRDAILERAEREQQQQEVAA